MRVRVAALGVVLLAACGVVPAASPCRAELAPVDDPPVHHDPDLEARIPDEVAGAPLEVQSICASATDTGGMALEPAFLEQVGVELADVSMALNTPEIGGENIVTLTAYRYYGSDEDAIAGAMLDAAERAGETLAPATRAGREVHLASPVLGGVVVYTAEDTLYLLAGDAEAVDEIVAALP